MNKVSESVQNIISQVRQEGDQALCRLAHQFDGVTLRPEALEVPRDEIVKASKQISPSFAKAINECAANIEAFAKSELKHLSSGWMIKRGPTKVGQRSLPVDSVGLYIPGGRFPYPSTVLMSAIPARIAGVKRIVMVTPPKNLTPEVLAAAALAGVQSVYRVGGAGAIAALAYGTARVQKVDFIVGPGNQYVMEAKRQVYGDVGIDSLAGPSEVVTIVDRSTPVEYIQADLLAQAEHDPDAKALLLCPDADLLEKVRQGLDPKIADRVELRKVASLDEAIRLANEIAPEHLELLVRHAEKLLPRIRHAGAIFVGPMSPAAMGDYVAGPSHVLPTNRAARFSSGLSVATFMKRSSVIYLQGVTAERPRWEAALAMAETEGMEYHAKSLRIRMTQ